MKTTVVVLTICVGWAAAQDRMTETLRKGVIQEESQHNLPAALETYKSVVAEFEQGRGAAATAMFRLAEAYRKQHKEGEAKALYQRVVQEFGDQSAVAEQSGKILAGTLNVSPPKVPQPARAATQEAARQHYRSLLLQEIDTANRQVDAEKRKFELGTITNETVIAAITRKIQLEKELAVFDMGKTPGN